MEVLNATLAGTYIEHRYALPEPTANGLPWWLNLGQSRLSNYNIDDTEGSDSDNYATDNHYYVRPYLPYGNGLGSGLGYYDGHSPYGYPLGYAVRLGYGYGPH